MDKFIDMKWPAATHHPSQITSQVSALKTQASVNATMLLAMVLLQVNQK